MPVSELMDLARKGSFEEFESRALELLEAGELSLSQLAGAYEQLERDDKAERLATLTQMIFENVDVSADPKAALRMARVALVAAPKDEGLRKQVVELYRTVYGADPGFEVVMSASGLEGGRPVRMALKLLDLCLELQPGDTLISRMDDRVVEITEIDRENGLFTLRSEGRVTTRPAPEVVREYDRIAADDFRVLRQLRPDQLPALIEDDPLAVIIGLIHAHGEMIDADLLKHELVPRYIESKAWSKWWTRARNAMKKSPHIIVEGRSPVIISYTAEARTPEEEAWETFQGQKHALEWLATIEGYLREKASLREKPDKALLERAHNHLVQEIARVQSRHPAEALTCALIIDRLADKGMPATDETRGLAAKILHDANRPTFLLQEIPHDALRERGFELFRQARPGDWAPYAAKWLPQTPANLMDKIASELIDAGQVEPVQAFVDEGLSDLAEHPELVYWLWKGPKKKKELNLPSDDELFKSIVDTASALGRTVAAEDEVIKAFRERTKAALALRDFAKARRCMEQLSEAAAVPLRHQLDRLEGMGDVVRMRLLDLLRDVYPQLWVVKRRRIEPWADPETLWATPEGIERRKAERDDIVNVQMRENAKRIGEAASHGDLSENSEYKFALEERDLLRARLAKVNEELAKARPIEPQEVPEEHVGVGSRVRLRNVDDGSERIMTFLGPFETDTEQGIYSYQAPVAQQLMGQHVGDQVTLTVDGLDVTYEVVHVENALGAGKR